MPSVDGGSATTVRREFLTEQQNHTGYSQVLQETEFDAAGNPTEKIVYTIGHDQISQTSYLPLPQGEGWGEGSVAYFGTDGHGSVRVLYDAAAAIVQAAGTPQIYHFDAYGNLLSVGGQSLTTQVSPLTTYLYSGEAFDFTIGQQYLRARWYDPTTGRFNRLDPFFGNQSDPQSFHKYAYVHGDPVNGVDPTGEFLISLVIGSSVTTSIRNNHAVGGLTLLARLKIISTLLATATSATLEGIALYSLLISDALSLYRRTHVSGTAGKKIDDTLIRTAAEIEAWWEKRDDSEKRRLISFSGIYRPGGWDVSPLAENASIQKTEFGTEGWANRTVTVDGNSYYAHEVNYFYWGLLNALAYRDGMDVSRDKMGLWVFGWRMVGDAAYAHVQDDGAKYGRIAWANAGWDYVMSGKFTDPTAARVYGLTSTEEVYDKPLFTVFIDNRKITN